jgi:hypothetical protein
VSSVEEMGNIMADSDVESREAEVAALIARALDPEDPYDGHHGNDRSDDSIAFARETNPELAARLEDKVRTGATE